MKKPFGVWVILVIMIYFFVTVIFNTFHFPFASLALTDKIIQIVMLIIPLAAMVSLFLMRKIVMPLFCTILGLNIFIPAYYIIVRHAKFPASSWPGIIISIAITAGIIIYLHFLSRENLLA